MVTSPIANQLVVFSLTILIMLVGLDFLMRAMGPRAHGAYRRELRRGFGFARRQITRFMRWAWREHHEFVLGAIAGALAVLYFTGRLS